MFACSHGDQGVARRNQVNTPPSFTVPSANLQVRSWPRVAVEHVSWQPAHGRLAQLGPIFIPDGVFFLRLWWWRRMGRSRLFSFGLGALGGRIEASWAYVSRVSCRCSLFSPAGLGKIQRAQSWRLALFSFVVESL